jgi:hypothetical protein
VRVPRVVRTCALRPRAALRHLLAPISPALNPKPHTLNALLSEDATSLSCLQEEDLSTNTGGFALCEDLKEEEVSAALLAQEEELQQQLKLWKAARALDGSPPGAGADAACGDGADSGGVRGGEDAQQGAEVEALLARIRLRRGWYAVVCHLTKGFKGLRPARKSIGYSLAQLALVRASVHLYQEAAASAAEGARTCCAFQPLLNLKHMAPSPPRAVRLLSVDEALDELGQVLEQLDRLCARLPLVSNLMQLQHLLADLGSSLHPQPAAIPRSFLRIMLWSENKILGSQGSMVQWVRDSMLDYMLPDSALASPEAADFIARAAKVLSRHPRLPPHEWGCRGINWSFRGGGVRGDGG